ncbi:hypothetical protein [Hyphomonas sp.]|uniref:hypothetical protein n=1 Tax=Hyphomonas sp. TaxID=87 RepID=UPI0025C04C51|nr:hypothetical protein [Hyphomonas sp.]
MPRFLPALAALALAALPAAAETSTLFLCDAPLISESEAPTGERVLGGYFQIETALRAAAEAYAGEPPCSKRGGMTAPQ